MPALAWLAAYSVIWWHVFVVFPEDVTLRLYISIFFMGGAFRGIVNALWRKLDD